MTDVHFQRYGHISAPDAGFGFAVALCTSVSVLIVDGEFLALAKYGILYRRPCLAPTLHHGGLDACMNT